ncbi:DegQ family serine endoprotease [Teredinibacter sp. KSP-S5-2]|uniref:DegQ family serine endoprotease n=1 Tax=Teredinibacter sp. KSP-S5-2 TaxID=3034506 RepID=UPI002934A571|nr:DegQ family serine endoprotease [Teredinibacter sp. KSP-S5-2]WNO11417.1 DegQ family serine endoprotease [Teredinibacter sp. KSP-S5-2]
MLNYISRLFLILIVIPISLAYGALPAADREGNPLPSLAPMLKDVNPAVVNIATYSTQQYTYNPLLNDPFFRHFFNIPEPRQRIQPQKKQQSAGSGVIVNAKRGIVMTNFHVIKGADEIQVSLIDGRTYQAKLLGSDPDLDIAILEINGEDLTQVSLANSDRLEVGDFVVAIGNPFGLGQTVTTGVVSALGRSGLGIEGYENFIQTDASINPGNSGGALVNLKGELVGINTAIIAPSGGNVGIGFAIPINMAKASMEQIIRHGEVKRGQIGVGIQDITQDLRSAFGLKNGVRGVLISNVMSESPADKAGLKAGDIILEVDGQITDSPAKFRSQLGIKSIDDIITLTVLRENKTQTIRVKVGDQQSLLNSGRALHPMLEGVEFSNNPNNNGVKVMAISPRSTAAYSGLRPGDIVVAANRIRVTDINSFMQALRKSKRSVLLQIERNGNTFFVVIR